jgi:hypothetical protein
MTDPGGSAPWPGVPAESPPVVTAASPPVWGAAPSPVSPDPGVSPDAVRRRRNRKLALVVAAVVAVAILAVVGWTRQADPDTAATGTSVITPPLSDPGTGTAPTTLVPPTTEEITAEVLALSQFVEQQRGLQFKEPVAVEVLTPDEFSARVGLELNEDASRIEELGRLLSALGLITAEEDFVGTVITLLSSEALGYYDPVDGAMVVAADRITVMTRRTIVHELVHALDDQWFDLDRPAYDDLDDETAFGFSSVVEGNAARVDTAWVATLPEPEQRELFRLESLGTGRTNPATVPAIVYELLYAPYLFGFDLVSTLLLAGGEQEVDQALTDPPTTSSAVLWPERYISGFKPTPVATPPSDGEPTDSGMFGELLLRLSLASALLESDATAAARGWRGDAYVMWRTTDDNDCVRVDTQTANARARDLLTQALTDWTSTLPDASTEVLDGTSVRFTSCSVEAPASDSGSPL